MLEMFGLNCFRVRRKSWRFAVLNCHIKVAQLVACLMIYVSHAFFMSVESFEVYLIGSSHTFLVSVTWLLKLVTVDLSLNTRTTFPMVMIKQKIQIIVYQSIDECLF